MALIHCSYFSEVLGLNTAMDVILPENAEGLIGMASGTASGRVPCLWLLHGLSDDQTTWQRRTSIERYVAPLGIAVVMPAVHRSFYTNMRQGYRYWDHISEEVPAKARAFFPLSSRREENMVAGLSMGGYGAFKLALRCPENYAAAASLSGALDLAGHESDEGQERAGRDIELVFGPDVAIRDTDDDLFACARKLVASGAPQPRLYQWCGTEDFLYQDNVRFHELARELDLNLTYEDSPGDHQWSYWDQQIQRVLEWMSG